MPSPSPVVSNTISVTTSDYGTTITDVIRGKSGVTGHPTTNVVDVVNDAIWWSNYAEKPGKYLVTYSFVKLDASGVIPDGAVLPPSVKTPDFPPMGGQPASVIVAEKPVVGGYTFYGWYDKHDFDQYIAGDLDELTPVGETVSVTSYAQPVELVGYFQAGVEEE